jgi:hypothetical protein
MFRATARLSAQAPAIARKSPCTKLTPTVSMATSVPQRRTDRGPGNWCVNRKSAAWTTMQKIYPLGKP